MIDVYQAATQMTDESGQTYPFTIDTLLDNALGAEGYYGVFTANMHTDAAVHPASDAIVASAQARGVPVVSARQMLTWLDGRNGSVVRLDRLERDDKLEFTIDHAAGANGLRAMVPTTSSVGALTGVKLNGSPVPDDQPQTIKGREYAFFDAAPGSYEAIYAVDETAPAISSVPSSVSGSGSATITWNTNEAADSRVDYGTNPDALTASQSGSTLVTSHSVELTGLKPTANYYYRVSSQDAAGNSSADPVPPAAPRKFTTSPLTFEDTTVSDFSAGSPDSSTQMSQTGDGELILKPTVGEEFSGGPDLPAGWSSCPWTSFENCTSGGASVWAEVSTSMAPMPARSPPTGRVAHSNSSPASAARASSMPASPLISTTHRTGRSSASAEAAASMHAPTTTGRRLKRSYRALCSAHLTATGSIGARATSATTSMGRWLRPTRQISVKRRCGRSQAISTPGARNSRSTGSI